MQRIEIGIAVDAADDRFTVNHKAGLAVSTRGLDDARIALGPVVATFGDQPYAVAVALQAQAVAIAFDLVEPVWAGLDGLFRSLANKARNS